jgi:hypothetical protein
MRIFIFSVILFLFGIHTACSSEDLKTVGGPGTPKIEQLQPSPALTADVAEFDEPKLAAINALSRLKHLLTVGQNFQEMGFDNLEQLDRASLSEPASVYAVGIDQLRNFNPGSDPQSLLVDTNRMVFPVVADGTGRTLITLEKRAGKWRFVSFGDQSVAGNLVRVREDKTSAPGGLPTPNYFVIQVKALFVTFLGNRQPGGTSASALRLVPLNGKTELKMGPAFRENRAFLMANPEFNAEEEGTMKAKDVFSALSTTAKKIDSSKPF